MKNVILLRYGEIHLKGKNRSFFENILFQNLQKSLAGIDCKVSRISGRYLVSDYDQRITSQVIEKCKKVFGFVSLSPAWEVDTSIENIKDAAMDLVQDISMIHAHKPLTFKVKTKRADKKFPVPSDEFSAQMGEFVLDNFDEFTVKMQGFDIELNIDIREHGKTYVCWQKIDCLGGMPVGSAGSGLLMLSGGIDSPVAGYMMAKRGLKLSALHFHSYPYTSLQAREKVLDLAKILTNYTGGEITVYMVPFTKIQEQIHQKCSPNYMINIMRRIMFRIAERLCVHNKIQTVVTGENLGQVASQTIESLTNTNSVMQQIPVMRPLIAFDKIDIIKIAEEIGTYNTSILPYEDCCTVFLPENPIIKPSIKNSQIQEGALDIESLIADALANIEVLKIKQ